jgi:hypothetical protein
VEGAWSRGSAVVVSHRRFRIISSLVSLLSFVVFIAGGLKWQESRGQKGRNTVVAGLKRESFGDTPCEVGRLRVDWRANTTRRCEGDRWVRLSWEETNTVARGDRELPLGGWWFLEALEETGENSISGERMGDYQAVITWKGVYDSITIGVREGRLSSSVLEAKAKRRRPSERTGSFGTGFFVDYGDTDEGSTMVYLPGATLDVSGPDRMKNAEFMALQYQ